MTQAVFFNDTDDIAQVLSSFKHLLCLFLLLHNENLPLKWQIVYCKKQKEKNTKQKQQPKPVVFEWLVTTVQPTDRETYEKRSLIGKVISLPPYPWSFVVILGKSHTGFLTSLSPINMNLKPTSIVS